MMDGGYTVIGKDKGFFGTFTFHSPQAAIAKAQELIADGVRHVVIYGRRDEEYSVDRFLDIFHKVGLLDLRVMPKPALRWVEPTTRRY